MGAEGKHQRLITKYQPGICIYNSTELLYMSHTLILNIAPL